MPPAVRFPRARREMCRARTPADRWARASHFELLRCGGHREDERQATKSRATCPIPGWRPYKLAGRTGANLRIVPLIIYAISRGEVAARAYLTGAAGNRPTGLKKRNHHNG